MRRKPALILPPIMGKRMIQAQALAPEKNGTLCVLEGSLSVRAAVNGGRRTVYKVYIDQHKKEKRDRKTLALLSFLRDAGVQTELAPRSAIEELVQTYAGANAGTTHGGVIALASERQYEDVCALLSGAAPGDYFVYLDGVEDPFNFGYSVRSLYAMGCKGILLPARNWSGAAGIAARASAGASELAALAVAPEDDRQTVELCRRYGIDIVCSALGQRSVPLHDFTPHSPFLLFIGGEKRGISPVFLEAAKQIVHIPYVRETAKYSLPTASVCAIYANALAPYVRMALSKEKA